MSMRRGPGQQRSGPGPRHGSGGAFPAEGPHGDQHADDQPGQQLTHVRPDGAGARGRRSAPAALGDAAAAYDDLLRQVAAGEISLDMDPEPLAKVEQVWPQAGSDRRIVFVP
jgi:hypothetical protein